MDNRSLVIKGGLAALVVLLVFGDYFQPEQIKTVLGKAGSVAPLACMIFMALAVIIPVIPTLFLDIATGAIGGAVAAFLDQYADTDGPRIALKTNWLNREQFLAFRRGTLAQRV
jgi:hypothetical protein